MARFGNEGSEKGGAVFFIEDLRGCGGVDEN